MKTGRRRSLVAALALLGMALMLQGCAPSLQRAETASEPRWSGRIALKVESAQEQSFVASFELRGNTRSGELALFTPLGGTVVALFWRPGEARLRANGGEQRYDTLEELTQQATGTVLPVGALFDWLGGIPTAAAGWQPDLTQLSNGRLTARRSAPSPVADLRVVLDQ